MAIDYAEKEREFVSELKADTGRDLGEWMQAIRDADLPHRNDIIDWLRGLGFTFANASWLERIHANGGRLIYATNASPSERQQPPQPKAEPPERAAPIPSATDAGAKILAFTPPRRSTQSPSSPPAPVASAPVAPEGPEPTQAKPAAASPPQAPPRPAGPHTAGPQAFAADVEKLIAAAKGLRPLAHLTLNEIVRVIPDARIEADGPLIVLSAPRPFLALLTGAKTLRLYGDFAGIDDSRVTRAEAAMKVASKAPPPFATVLPLDDARLIDATFTEMVKTAARRAHS